jgi:small-conductance mechanosensitive channel/CRP-like cAMP-binding protein
VRASRFWGPLAWTVSVFAVYYALLLYPRRFTLSTQFRETYFGKDLIYLRLLGQIGLIFLVVRLLDAFIFDVVTSRKRLVAPQLLRQIVSITLYLVLFGWAISQLTNVTAWLTGGTLLAAVVGLALQDTLGNLFSGIALHMEGSFEVGDVIHSGEYHGVVEAVNWRATHIRGFNNQLVVLPNSVISRERFEIFPRGNFNARVLPVGVDSEAVPARVIDVLTQAVAHIDGVAREIPCLARIGAFNDSSITYEVKYFLRDYSMRDRVDADARRAIWYALRRNAIALAYPIRTYRKHVETVQRQVTPEEIQERLEHVDLLQPLSRREHEAIAAATRLHTWAKGETIIRRGAVGESMFVIVEGRVSVRVPDETDAQHHEVAQLREESVFGEMALLTGERRTADIVALTDVTTLEITREALQPILADNPDLAHALSEKVIERQRASAELVEGAEAAATSVLSRIRSYFGL